MTSPTLDMLWETCDPQDTLTTRFGFANADAAARWATATVERHWDLQVIACERITMSFKNALAWLRTPDGRIIAKWSIARHRFARLAELAELTAWLDRRGIPVSAPVPVRDGLHQVEVDGRSIGLQRHLDGDLLDVSDPRQVAVAGATLARLHEALSSYPEADRVAGLAPPTKTLGAQITDWLETNHPQVPERALHALRRRLAEASTDVLPTQLVHGDYRSANILWSNDGVTAVLDFEEAWPDRRIVDLARSAVLLGTRFHDWGPVPPDVRAVFLDGYRSVCRLTAAEMGWWDTLVLWFSLAMIPDDDRTGWAPAAMETMATGQTNARI